jgi:hypothetical protein
MEPSITLDQVYMPSEDVVAREIDGELLLVPIASGIGDLEDELYTLNDSGKAIWYRLDGKSSLSEVVQSLSNEYDVSQDEIRTDVIGLVSELVKRRILFVA